jgi:serine/threonine protein kinase
MGSMQTEATLPLACSDGPPERPVAELTGYALEGLLGRGGQGEVHGARQLALGRTVAVKRLRAGCDGSDDERRFRAEAAVTALLEHPNIVPVHDLGRDPDGRLQLVMKRVSGRTWSAALLDAGLEVDAIARVEVEIPSLETA